MPPWISATSSSKGRSVMYGRDVALGDVDLAHDQVHVGVDVREELQRPLPLRRERLLVARGDDRVEADDARVELLAVRLVLLERAHEGPHVGEDGPERVVGVAVPLAERGELDGRLRDFGRRVGLRRLLLRSLLRRRRLLRRRVRRCRFLRRVGLLHQGLP